MLFLICAFLNIIFIMCIILLPKSFYVKMIKNDFIQQMCFNKDSFKQFFDCLWIFIHQFLILGLVLGFCGFVFIPLHDFFVTPILCCKALLLFIHFFFFFILFLFLVFFYNLFL